MSGEPTDRERALIATARSLPSSCIILGDVLLALLDNPPSKKRMFVCCWKEKPPEKLLRRWRGANFCSRATVKHRWLFIRGAAPDQPRFSVTSI